MNQKNEKYFIISIASGKGGTGKTTVATNLAKIYKEHITLLDCDVEAPNSHLFIKPKIHKKEKVTTFIPRVDEQVCKSCGRCSDLCQFNAIMQIKNSVLVFPELCHSCMGCMRICPERAITPAQKEIGTVSWGTAGVIALVTGRLRIGEAMSPPLIREVKRQGMDSTNSYPVIIDAPPGTSCPAIESIKHSDVVILVTEPTPFGLHDLKLAIEVVRVLGIPFGVVINRATIGDKKVYEYCQVESIQILAEIPDDREIAETYSRGTLAVESLTRYRILFHDLWKSVNGLALSQMEEVSP